jgi:hypothetical protein
MWGSTVTASAADKTCSACTNHDTCRAAVMALQPVACEDLTPHTYHRRMNLAQFLQPGEHFTAHDLARRAEATLDYTRRWCHRRAKTGRIEVVTGHKGSAPTIYRHPA